MRFTLPLFAVLAIVSTAQCHKILVVFPMASSSHFILGSTLARGLAEGGNDVTLLSPFEDKTPVKNGKYKALAEKQLDQLIQNNHVNMFEQRSMTSFFTSFRDMIANISTSVLTSEHLKTMLKNNEKFDVVIIEEFLTDSLKVIPHLFGSHLIIFGPMGANSWLNHLVGNPTPLAYSPEMNTGFPERMSFFQRVGNVLGSHMFSTMVSVLFTPRQKEILKELYPQAPELEALKHNASLVLLNSNPGTMSPVPMVPQMIPIGGYHVQPPKALPKDLQDYLDNAKDGVVYFSMGSVLKSKDMPREKIEVLMNAFKQLKQKVLWKWENDQLEGKPDNVRIEKWLPQQSILAHPNVKLFITHGGLLSTTETIYHGKPVLAIPIFGDQPDNARRMINGGFAQMQSFEELTSGDGFLAKVKEMLDNPKYYANAQQRSKIFHDLPMKPIDTANFWVDYVVRHNGAKHLRVVGVELTWYQNALLDVWAFIASVIIGSTYVSWKLLKCLLCSKKKSKVTSASKKKN